MKSRHLLVTTLTAGLFCYSFGGAQAQDQSTKGSSDRMKSDASGSADQRFMMKAAQGGMAEVELGKIAKDHAASQAVKDFGQQMVDDHSKAGDELKALASRKNVTLPTNLDAKDQAVVDRLSKLNGAAFGQGLYGRHGQRPQERCRGVSARG